MDRQFKAVDTRIKNDNFEILGYWDLVSPQLPNFPKHSMRCVAQSSNKLYTKARPHLI